MKYTFLATVSRMAVEGEGGAPVVTMPATKEYSSEKLTELNEQSVAMWNEMIKLPPGSKAAVNASIEFFKHGKLIDAEILSLKGAEIERENAEKRNAKTALVDSLINAAINNLVVSTDKKASDDAKTAASDALKNAREIVVNEVLGKFAATPKQQVSTDGAAKPSASKGATGAAIVELHVANLAGGMTPAESKKSIEAAGYSRGTTGAVVLAWEKEQGLK